MQDNWIKYKLEKPDSNGWSFDSDWLLSATDAINEIDGGEGVSMEQVEAVLLFLSEPPNPSHNG